MSNRPSQSILQKLLRCQQIIGYNFRDISLLQRSLTLRENKRLATAGDTYVQVALVDRWFSLGPESTSFDFSTIRGETVSNSNLAKVGFRRGLHACTIPAECTGIKDMADTVEAILGAVYRDALFEDGERKAIKWDEFESVVARLGINHRLLASDSDLRWSLTPMRTTRKILPRFFTRGNHLELARIVAGMSGKPQSPSLAKAATCPGSAHMARPGLNRVDKVDSTAKGRADTYKIMNSEHSTHAEIEFEVDDAPVTSSKSLAAQNPRSKSKSKKKSKPKRSSKRRAAKRARVRRNRKMNG